MKGFISKTMTLALACGGLALAGGCESYRSIVDPCYPERYEYQARREVVGAIAPQVLNGHVLDQTVWNYQFELGSDRLTPGGMEHLGFLARRRPAPDPNVYVQTAQDVTYDPKAPDRFAEARANLDNRRVQAVQNYLMAQTAGRHLTFDVTVHDPNDVGLGAVPVGVAVGKMYLGYQGNLPTTAGAGASNVSGGGGATGGGGGGAPAGGGR